MMFLELREQIAALMCRQVSLDKDWESNSMWLKEMYRKNAGQILDLIDKNGWVLQPKTQTSIVNSRIRS